MSEDRTLTWSYGGGTQSVAIAILVAQEKLPKPACIVMADTGREASETWEYHTTYTAPLLRSVGLEVEIVGHEHARVDLYSSSDGRVLLPMYAAEGALRAFCSAEWKRDVIRRYLRAKGYGPKRPITTWLGFSRDDSSRLKQGDVRWQKLAWPLCFSVPMTRYECVRLVESFGWPKPPRSRCWMCPYQRNAEWRELRDNSPADWQKAIALEKAVTARDKRGGLFLHEQRVPLEEVDLGKDEEELPLFAAVQCSNVCYT